jgi:hypothetical protein
LLGLPSAIRALSLQRWIGLPAARARCVGHFLAIAATLAATKVLLSTIGVALFVADQGAAGLPPFYLGFAALAILLSFGLSSIIDRAPKVLLAQITFGGLLVGTAALRLLLALEVPGVSFALLASATAFEIIFDIVFWVVVATYLDTFEFRRATPLVYMAFALGGAAGGALGRMGAGTLPPADLLLLLLPAAALVVVQLGVVAGRFREVPEYHPDTADESFEKPGLVPLARIVRRYPLALLIALNALAGTLLYGLSEFLIVLIYQARFTSEAELAQFLALLFAFMQILEFGLLYTLTRFLLERSGPIVRNLAFPLTSLGGLIFLTVNPRLLAAVVVHVNIEILANALLLPISNANYAPLPLALQGRARTLSEGIFYPTGLALAGAVLWTADPETAVLQVEFAALIFSGLFVLLGAGVGLLFVPTLHANVGSGLIRLSGTTTVAPPASRVRALLQSREPELRRLGLALAQRLDPSGFADDLLTLAAHPDRTSRTELAQLIAAAPRSWAQTFLDKCLTAGSEEALNLALLVMLIQHAPLQPEQAPRVFGARDPAVVVLGHVVTEGLGALPRIRSLIQRSAVASALVDAIVNAQRTDCAALLLACLETAGPEQQHRALVMLNESAAPPPADVVPLLARHRNPGVRAEAIVLLSRTCSRPIAVRRLIAALDDRDGRVRRRAAEELCQHGDRATALLRHRLGVVTMASLEVVWILARIASPRARHLLAAYIRTLEQDTQGTARLLLTIAASPERARWAALEFCLRDHRERIVDVVLGALSPAVEARLARRLRNSVRGADQRSRANAYELIAAVPASRRTPGAVALLRRLLFEDSFDTGLAASRTDGPEHVLDQAMACMGPWVRRAAALSMPSSPSRPARRPANVAGPAERNHGEEGNMGVDDQEFERVIALKRTPLFRCVPFETMVEVARSVRSRGYLAGEEVIASSTDRQDLLILEAGALAIEDAEGTTKLAAPACFGEVVLLGEPPLFQRVVAIEDSTVLRLHRVIFRDLIEDHPELGMELAKLLARRLRRLHERPRSG